MTNKSKLCPVCNKIIKVDMGAFSQHTYYDVNLKFDVVCEASGKHLTEAAELAKQTKQID